MSEKNNDTIYELNDKNQHNSEIGNVSESTDGSLNNDKNATNSLKARAYFNVASEKNYYDEDDNPKGWMPTLNEICVDEKGVFYVWAKDANGKLRKLSALKDIVTKFDELSRLGILQNAEAFRLNGKIYNFMFDNEKMILRLNTELDIYSEYKYYRVRKIERSPVTGDYIYITGIRNPETNKVVTNLGSIIKDGEKAIPSAVSMINPCIDGESYVVEFFDMDRFLIGSQLFYARSVVALDFSLSPDVAVKDLIINTNQPYDQPNSCYLYQNQDINNLIIRVGLEYLDGKVRDVTEEGISTGRLIFKGRDSIDTSQLTTDPTEVQKITVIYFLDIDNVDNPQPLDNEIILELLDAETLSITKELNVYIIEDIYDPIIDIVLHGYKESKIVMGESTTTDIYKIKVFARYESGVDRDITPVMDADRFICSGNFVYNKKTNCLETSKILANFAVEVRVPQGRGTTLFRKTFNCEFNEYNKRMNINSSKGGFDTHDATKLTLFNTRENKMRILETDYLGSIEEQYSYKYGLADPAEWYIPTHVIVRNALDPKIVYSGIYGVDSYSPLTNVNGIIDYTLPDNQLLFEDTPLLVEFFRIELDETTGARKEIFLTGLQRTYAKSTSITLG